MWPSRCCAIATRRAGRSGLEREATFAYDYYADPANARHLIVEDMCRGLAAGVNGMVDTLVHEEHVTRDHLEMLVAIELLRATPRFWSGATLWITANDLDSDGYLLTILCNDGYPPYANVTNRLFERACNLMCFMEDQYGRHYTDLLVGAAWVSPRTWQYETRCWRRAE